MKRIYFVCLFQFLTVGFPERCWLTSLFLLPISVVHATGNVKKPSFENIRKLAEQTEENEAGRRLNVSPQKLAEEIENARVELGKYLAAKPDDIEALLLAARLGPQTLRRFRRRNKALV